MLQILPPLAYSAIALCVLAVALWARSVTTLAWQAVAAVALAFGGFSLVTVWQDGLLPFWVNHTSNLAGNQVWFDLLLAVGIAFYLIAPRARAVGMRILPWALAVLATASIALLPMLARLIWLEARQSRG